MSLVLLEGAGVEKRFGRIPALRGIDFTLHPGESVSILGANGAGKSTLLRILAGLSRPSRGVFHALRQQPGESAPSDPKAQNPSPHPHSDKPLSREALRGEVGYVGHATLVYSELTARENLEFAARLHRRTPRREQIDAILADVDLIEFADRRAGSFSRGMAQRLSIARAIVHEPHVLLLDEPFTGLDESSAERLSTQLSALRDGDRTLILVTHDPRRAIELSDRALILHRGEIRATPGRSRVPGDGPAEFEPFDLEALRETLSRLSSLGPRSSNRTGASSASSEQAGSPEVGS